MTAMPTMAEEIAAVDQCAQCHVMGVPLLACDDPDVRSKASSPGGKPRFCNNCMVGKKVRVFWPVDSSWYTGTVQEYDESTGEHLLRYQDGDTEWVKIGENNTTGMSGGMDHSGSGGVHPGDSGMDSGMKGNDVMAAPSGDGGGYPPVGPGAYYMPYGPPGNYPPNSMGSYGGMSPAHMPPPYGMYPQYAPYYAAPPPQTAGVDKSASGSLEDSYGRRKTGPKAWSKQEDELLLNIVHSMQWPMKWTLVAQHLTDRTGKQCRERYVNHLNPRLKSTDWSTAEDATIFHLYNSIGSHWAKMSKVIPGRTDNGIKNRFHNIRRQYEREDEHRLRLSSSTDFPEEIRFDRLRPFPKHLTGKTRELWDMEKAIGVLAAQSVLGGNNINRASNKFGPFRESAGDDICVRCGFLVPSVQTGDDICTKTGWCRSCSRIPPHITSSLLRECLNLRRTQHKEQRSVVESWEEFYGTAIEGDGKKGGTIYLVEDIDVVKQEQ